MSDNDIGWRPGVYNDAVNADGWPDMDAPHPFPDGNSASGFGRSPNSRFAANHYYEPPGMHTGLSGQPVNPRYPTKDTPR
jgi:hypothetical protein